MITQFKIFESQNANDYIGKFFIVPNEDSYTKELYKIILVDGVEFKWKEGGKEKIWPPR